METASPLPCAARRFDVDSPDGVRPPLVACAGLADTPEPSLGGPDDPGLERFVMAMARGWDGPPLADAVLISAVNASRAADFGTEAPR